jgi:hypothetical protein
MQTCLFCGGDASAPDHLAHCDGRQGQVEAREPKPLRGQLALVFALVRDRQWYTYGELQARLPRRMAQATISAYLRDLRKRKHGGHVIERRSRGDREHGLYEYRLADHEAA